MKKLLFVLFLFVACQPSQKKESIMVKEYKNIELGDQEAIRLAQLPLKCIQQEFPNKLNQSLEDQSEIGAPQMLHPAFYGCYDWHSSVHGHWMLVKLIKTFPNIGIADEIKKKLLQNINKKNIQGELAYFKRKSSKGFERTYGWAWLLKLSEELLLWDDPIADSLTQNLLPLTNFIINEYIEFLPKLKYPIRVGEHTNTAFGLTFAWDYAKITNNQGLLTMIENRARDFYLTDSRCPISWEPSGYDFLSPCFEEIDIMRRVLSKDEFIPWLASFMPSLSQKDFELKPGQIIDRTDGNLVHLDGLNFSRAWCLLGIANKFPEYRHLKKTAYEHIQYSLPNIVDGDYSGEHWLASFAVYALASDKE